MIALSPDPCKPIELAPGAWGYHWLLGRYSCFWFKDIKRGRLVLILDALGRKQELAEAPSLPAAQAITRAWWRKRFHSRAPAIRAE
jgi:hypothetical protein